MLDITLGTPDPERDRSTERRVGLHLRLSGALDVESAEALDRWFDATEGLDGHVIVDLAEVDFIDSRGLRALLTAFGGDRRVTLTNVQPEVRRTFQMAGVEHLLLDSGAAEGRTGP